MIEHISISIPESTEKLIYFQKMLKILSNNFISFDIFANDNPQISFIDREQKQEFFQAGRFRMGMNLNGGVGTVNGSIKPTTTTLNDKIGKYLLVKWPNAVYPQLDFQQLWNRLNGHIKFLDHAGINIYQKLTHSTEYKKLREIINSSSQFLGFPGNSKWKFIIPQKINEPLFEIVEDFGYNYPEMQLDIQTDLTEAEVLELFPLPYGHRDAIPNIPRYCVSLFMYTGWSDTSLRVDVRFKKDENWHEWLMEKGK